MGNYGDVENLTITNDGYAGISVLSYSRIVGNSVTDCGDSFYIYPGIWGYTDGLIYGNTANSNTGDGINTDGTSGTNVFDNVANSNGGYGLDLTDSYTGFGSNTVSSVGSANSSGCWPVNGMGNPLATSMLTNTCAGTLE